MTPRVLPFVPQTNYSGYNFSSLLSFPNRIIYLLLTMATPFENEMEYAHKILAEVETDEDSDFDNEDNGPEDILEEIF
ncbi:hypothetical protein AVEN_102526-1 [Araneus ventricosus]|uniref:Uncharacterized protein n=1 Tax=Araneus ventricosus TaxID=182803 RepID=A0A4Y2BIT8_ARAVE|nr:hypothetical protein AVEN_102526-1 [Araneus ventricosus]